MNNQKLLILRIFYGCSIDHNWLNADTQLAKEF